MTNPKPPAKPISYRTMAYDPGIREFGAMLKRNTMHSIRVAMPGTIEDYDPVTCTVTVKPAFSRVSADGEIVHAPGLFDVPVVTIQGGGVHIKVPIKKDDECLVIFSDEYLDTWFGVGGQQVPALDRSHDIADGIAVVGLNSQSNLLVSSIGATEGGLGEASAAAGQGAKVAINPATHKVTVAGPGVNNTLLFILQAVLTALAADPGLSGSTKTVINNAYTNLGNLLY